MAAAEASKLNNEMTSQMLPQVSDDLRDFLETITASLRFTPKETLIFF